HRDLRETFAKARDLPDELLALMLALPTALGERAHRGLGALEVGPELRDVSHRPFELLDDELDAAVGVLGQLVELPRVCRMRAPQQTATRRPDVDRAGRDACGDATAKPARRSVIERGEKKAGQSSERQRDGAAHLG